MIIRQGDIDVLRLARFDFISLRGRFRHARRDGRRDELYLMFTEWRDGGDDDDFNLALRRHARPPDGTMTR